MVGIFLLKLFKEQIHRVLEVFVILPDFHRIDHFNQGREVVFLLRRTVMNISNQRRIEQGFRFHPEIIATFALTLGIGDQRSHEFQDVLFGMDIGKRVIVHGFLEVDSVEHLHAIPVPDQHFSALCQHTAFRVSDYIR